MRGSLVFIVFILACGGSSDQPPGPLSKHFDDMYIAAVPLDEKGSVVKTENDYSVSKMEQAKGEADYNEVTTQLSVARNDQKASHLAVDSANQQRKDAEKSADMNRINQSQIAKRNAEDLEKAAELRVKYLDTYRNYLRRYWRYTQENMYWREAQYEAAKAQIAKAKGIAPKNVTYDAFPKQQDERGKRTQSAKEKAEQDKVKAVQARDAWLKSQQLADGENGRPSPSSLWDPMAPKNGPTTAGNGEAKPMTPMQNTNGNGSGAGGNGGSTTPQ